ncbi:Oidioi.mRNA.OKI2018_I69.XSR.g14322.t1.cds [Oikopleura dioica]|uniref:Oidioi.mRNA.OKI2018_I69.XSR.g14322.t1.cds n=1 Tax=Oikopleura dioica TaxID=34765 RepID=A0ABN7SA00_OIKDI|nr:Oidioi.mRNA.OKI2018_I69.XSR.g14322.t1.cds [Oikopleura dioica]
MFRRLSTTLRYQKLDARATLSAILDRTLCPASHANVLKVIDSNENGIIEPREIYQNLEDYDKDGSMDIDADEIKKWLHEHGKFVTKEQADKVFNQMDFNNDGSIKYEDFLALVTARLLTLSLTAK